MAVRIRLARRGRKKLALYDIVVADARAPRDGRFIEKLGNYNPNACPTTSLLKEENALKWLIKGAQPTNTVRSILSFHGVLLKKHLLLGVEKGAITREVADKRLEDWKKAREERLAKQDANTIAKRKEAGNSASREAVQAAKTLPNVLQFQKKEEVASMAATALTELKKDDTKQTSSVPFTEKKGD